MTAIDGFIAKIENYAIALLLVWITVVVSLQVIYRYFFDSALSWSEEMARLSLVWMTFIGAAAVTREGGHITVDILRARYSGWVARAFEVLLLALTIGFSLLLVRYGIDLGRMQWATYSTALQLPMTIFSLPVVTWAVLVVFHVIVAVGSNRHLRSTSRIEDGAGNVNAEPETTPPHDLV